MLPVSVRINQLILVFIPLFISFSGFAQVPNLLNYQGVARNSVGNPLPNQTMNLRLSVHNLTASGATVYTETRVIKTNLGGLFSVQIGSAGATSATGTIGGVNWLAGDKYLQVEIDPASNNNYLNMGTVQLVSVPYAFNAGTAGNSATVTTNANLTGAVTSIGNTTSIATSPALTGVPTAPTAAQGTNTNQIATTAFVQAAALTGPTGAQGAQGIQGLPGADGIAGPQGAAGAQGIQGLPGSDGAAGPQGIQGLTGPIGPAGVQGIPGVAGAQGIQGVAGPIGPAGVQGIPGTPGANGAPGAIGSVANVGTISNSSTMNGASIGSDGVLSLAPADGNNGGIVTNAAQTFAGSKTFSGNLITNGTLTAGTITYPNTAGSNGYYLKTDGSGTASWAAVAGGVSAVGSISSTSNINGATISGTAIMLTPADASNGGIVTNGTQIFAGAKTFSSIDGWMATGTFGSGTLTPTSGAGTRMMWYPKKSALRAGTVGSTQWDDTNIGNYSTAMGYSTTASGEGSAAIGNSSRASGNYSTAMGYESIASGSVSTAIGSSSSASGNYSTAMGQSSTASGTVGTAMGYSNTASGEVSTALGRFTNASGFASTTMGEHTTAKSFAETVIGTYNTNYTSTATYGNQFVSTDRLFVIGNGSYAANHDALVMLKNGNTTFSGSITAGTITYPNTSGTANQVLTTDGVGAASWQNTAAADAGTLTGSTLKSTVTNSSLTSVGTITTGTWSGTTIAVANGGTNSTATATAGGIGYGTGTAHAYTSVGTTGQLLSSNGTGVPTWVTPSSGLPTTGNTAGDMLYWNGASWVKVTAGTHGQTLTFINGAPKWITSFSLPANTVLSNTGRIWQDKNLGATEVANSSDNYNAYGSLYQWGRGSDGHQLINWTSTTIGNPVNSTTTTLSSTDLPVDSKFITINSYPQDWRSTSNNLLWQGVDGKNNPCPSGYRLPTNAEWSAEIGTWSSQSASGALASPLKLPTAGSRQYSDGSLNLTGQYGYFWSSTLSGVDVIYLNIAGGWGSATLANARRAVGKSVRCIKD